MATLIRAAGLALLCTLAAPGADAALTADYQFQNTRASSVGGAPALVDVGPGANAFATDFVDSVPRTVLTFPQGNGLSLAPTTGVTASNTYSIAILARLTTISGYRKYVDYKNGASDNGLYNYSGTLYFYPTAQGVATPIVAGSYAQVVITRDAAGNMVGYVNGVQQISFVDAATDGVIDAANTLRFFIDDTATGGNEASAGAVARIRVFNNVLTPSEVAGLDRIGIPPAQAVPVLSAPMLGALALLLGMLALLAVGRRQPDNAAR